MDSHCVFIIRLSFWTVVNLRVRKRTLHGPRPPIPTTFPRVQRPRLGSHTRHSLGPTFPAPTSSHCALRTHFCFSVAGLTSSSGRRARGRHHFSWHFWAKCTPSPRQQLARRRSRACRVWAALHMLRRSRGSRTRPLECANSQRHSGA